MALLSFIRTSMVFSVSMRSIRSDVLNSLISEVFITYLILLYVIASYNELCCYRQFLCSKTESFFGYFIRYSFCFQQYPARRNRNHESFRGTFAFPHTDFGRFLCYRLIRKNPDPELSFTFHMTCNSLTGCLDLSSGYPALFQSLNAK